MRKSFALFAGFISMIFCFGGIYSSELPAYIGMPLMMMLTVFFYIPAANLIKDLS